MFWRVDGNTILGRFYLMHMLCVRPEITDFTIGSSCDYSFVPEMCPSGNVEAITDSDEYLVIEMQPLDHEAAFLRPGPLEARRARSQVSANGRPPFTVKMRSRLVDFPCRRMPPQLEDAIAEADAFVARSRATQPASRALIAAIRIGTAPWRRSTTQPGASSATTNGVMRSAFPPQITGLRNGCFGVPNTRSCGKPPHVLPWHPDWPDFKTVLDELKPFFNDRSQRLLMLSNEPTAFTVALADNGERVHRMRCVPFLKMKARQYAPLEGKFDCCLLELPETDLRYGNELIDRIVPLLKVGGFVIVFVRNRRIVDRSGEFAQSMVRESARLIRSGAIPTDVLFVPANTARRCVRRVMASLRKTMDISPWIGGPIITLGGGLLIGVSLIGNVDVLRTTRRKIPAPHISSFVMRLIVDAPRIYGGQSYTNFGMRRNMTSERDPVEPQDASGETREAQYNRCVELKKTFGLTSLGLMTNQVWYDDPRRLTFLLARYKFVAKMFRGRTDVGEVGCGDAFGTRVVLQEVPNVTVYDFDPVFIDDIRARHDPRWPLKAEVHDIVNFIVAAQTRRAVQFGCDRAHRT